MVDQVGYIYILDEDGSRMDESFLDLTDRMVELREQFDERGVLGLVFHPDYADNGRFFVYYSAPAREGIPEGWDHTSHLSEFAVSEDDENFADAESERVVLEVDQPQFNHNGGQISFGPDGYLYIALGDGGGADDTGEGHPPLGNGQDITTLLGNILRIDVDAEDEERGYGIPEDNPFAQEDIELPDEHEWEGDEAREEIYAWGMRNPYRFSFDRETGDLWVADVGQNQWEEVSLVDEPGNYGWNLKEGTHGFDPENPDEVIEPEEAPDTGPRGEELIDPVIEYGNLNVHEDGRGISVIGGYVYRGGDIPDLEGHYVFADWSTSFGQPQGKLFVAAPPQAEGEMWEFVFDEELEYFVLGFGQDADGELYVLTTDTTGPADETGRVFRIVAGNGVAAEQAETETQDEDEVEDDTDTEDTEDDTEDDSETEGDY
ncbi:MAG: PQQ-dependent sugar dehydrogenase [Deinococcota bacterium]|nr:PQQ-dependent sugar dehydrogenase [Deinococcota bacterium]